MIKKMDKLKNKVKYDKKILLFMIIIILIGIIVGTIFTLILNTNDKKLVIEYIQSFIENIKNNKIIFKDSMKNAMILNIFYILIIWIMGISIIGIPIVILIIFWRAFVLGFSISSFIITYGLKGCIISFIYIFPHLIINLLFFLILSTYSIRISLKLISSIINKKTFDFKIVMNKYFYIFLISVFVISISVLYEVFVMPRIIKLVVSILF